MALACPKRMPQQMAAEGWTTKSRTLQARQPNAAGRETNAESHAERLDRRPNSRLPCDCIPVIHRHRIRQNQYTNHRQEQQAWYKGGRKQGETTRRRGGRTAHMTREFHNYGEQPWRGQSQEHTCRSPPSGAPYTRWLAWPHECDYVHVNRCNDHP